jgi:WD40 repeat protein
MRKTMWASIAGAALLVGVLTGCEGAVEVNMTKRLAPESPVKDEGLRALARAHSEASCTAGELVASPDPAATYGPGSIELNERELLDPALSPPDDDNTATNAMWRRLTTDSRLNTRTWDRMAAGQARCADGYLYLTVVLQDDGTDGFAPGVVRVTSGNDTTALAGITTDGSTVAVQSRATNLVAGTTVPDLYLYDVAGADLTATGIEPGPINSAALSPDGSTLVWDQGTIEGGSLIYPVEALDIATGTRSRRAIESSPVAVRALSGDGDSVAYIVYGAGGTRSSLAKVGQPVKDLGNVSGFPNSFSLSDDGRYLGFAWVGAEVRDLSTSTTATVAASCYHNPSTFTTNGSSLSGDGRYLAYSCNDRGAASDDTDLNNDVYVWDRTTGKSILITSGADGREVMSDPSISDDGRFVAFSYRRPGPGTTAGTYLWDRTTGRSTRIAPFLSDVAVSGDGSTVAFTGSQANTDLYVWANPAV